MNTNLTELLDNGHQVKIIVNATQYELAKDNRFLIPFMVYEHNEIRFGFADKDGNIVIPAKYDKVFDDFHNSDDLVRVGKRFVIDYGTEATPHQYKFFYCGLINSNGEELIPCNKYWELYFADDRKDLLVAKGTLCDKVGWSLIDTFGNVIIPRGKYTYIDLFYNGMARVQLCKRDDDGRVVELNGLINKKGEEIAPLGTGPCSFGWFRNKALLERYTRMYKDFL